MSLLFPKNTVRRAVGHLFLLGAFGLALMSGMHDGNTGKDVFLVQVLPVPLFVVVTIEWVTIGSPVLAVVLWSSCYLYEGLMDRLRNRRLDQGRCAFCAYILMTGQAICPECGAAHDRSRKFAEAKELIPTSQEARRVGKLCGIALAAMIVNFLSQGCRDF